MFDKKISREGQGQPGPLTDTVLLSKLDLSAKLGYPR